MNVAVLFLVWMAFCLGAAALTLFSGDAGASAVWTVGLLVAFVGMRGERER